MDGETLTWIFLAGGLILMLLEFALPGGVAFFLGISGVSIGILRFLGLLGDPVWAITAWLLTSIGLTIAIRPFIKKYFKSDTFTKIADEDYEAMDQVATVVSDLNEDDNSGRIRFDGATWNARSMKGRVIAGRQVAIRYRENTTWVVEAIDAYEPMDQSTKQKDKN
ncbi:MAG: NfeD family protein [Balneolaceae bacterium]|nr:NfeD family protein [Balneolaceae bacterium]TVR14954.1 MAG: NfeD family protein [Balneolaceae bacterium]